MMCVADTPANAALCFPPNVQISAKLEHCCSWDAVEKLRLEQSRIELSAKNRAFSNRCL
jgi:hypothetical protein